MFCALLDPVLGEVPPVEDLPPLADVKFLGTGEPLVAVHVPAGGVESARVGRRHLCQHSSPRQRLVTPHTSPRTRALPP